MPDLIGHPFRHSTALSSARGNETVIPRPRPWNLSSGFRTVVVKSPISGGCFASPPSVLADGRAFDDHRPSTCSQRQRGHPPVVGGGWLRKAQENVPTLPFSEKGSHPISHNFQPFGAKPSVISSEAEKSFPSFHGSDRGICFLKGRFFCLAARGSWPSRHLPASVS